MSDDHMGAREFARERLRTVDEVLQRDPLNRPPVLRGPGSSLKRLLARFVIRALRWYQYPVYVILREYRDILGNLAAAPGENQPYGMGQSAPPVVAPSLKAAEAFERISSFVSRYARTDIVVTDAVRRELQEYLAYHAPRLEYTLSLLRRYLPGQPKVLDLGSEPNVLALLAMSELGASVVGINASDKTQDISYEATFVGAGGELRIPVYQVDLGLLDMPLPDESFDAVFCFELIEHLTRPPDRMLKNAFRVLRPRGLLFLSTPNLQAYDRILCQIEGKTPPDLLFKPQPRSRHVQVYSMTKLRDLTEAAGFKILDAQWARMYPVEQFPCSPQNERIYSELRKRPECGGDTIFIVATK